MESELALGRAGQLEKEQGGLEVAFPIHTLNYWGDLNHSDSRYAFFPNTERFGELLRDVFELTSSEMKRVDVHVVGEGRIDLSRAMRERVLPSNKKRVIGRRVIVGFTGTSKDERIPYVSVNQRPIDFSLYLFSFWHFFVTERKFILSYVKSAHKENLHQRLLGKHMRVFSLTDDMLEFLEKSPDIVDERLREIAGIKLRKDILEAFVHEGSHVFDTSKEIDDEAEKKRRLQARLLGIGHTPDNFIDRFSSSPVVSKLIGKIPRQMPKSVLVEKLAEAAEKALTADPKWRDLISFEVNPNWPFNKNTPSSDEPIAA